MREAKVLKHKLSWTKEVAAPHQSSLSGYIPDRSKVRIILPHFDAAAFSVTPLRYPSSLSVAFLTGYLVVQGRCMEVG